MDIIKNIIIIICLLFISSCNNEKNYNVVVTDGIVNITMKCPTIGVVGINKVGFDGFTPKDINREVFNKVRNRNYSGDYIVFVTMQFIDNYGNYYDSQEKVKVDILNGEEMKKYADFKYFKGVSIYKAYPWIYSYK